MKIGLADVDGHNFPSLPLMKLSAWHKKNGDLVEPWFPLTHYDRVYASKVFTFSPDIESVINADEVVFGGTGYFYPDGGAELTPEVEHIYPDYELYREQTVNTDRAFGFLTRGCPRGCGPCIVKIKEGAVSRRVADLSEFWRGQNEIKLLDPNLLACREREELLKQLAASGAYVDFTQGLDIRLVGDVIGLLDKIRIARIHFAWDYPEEDLTPFFEHYIKTAKPNKHRPPGAYVLTNYNSAHEHNLERVYKLRDLGFKPYIMIYEKETAPRETRLLQRWVNNRLIFNSVERFEDYDPKKG
jgi:hypothetical protein